MAPRSHIWQWKIEIVPTKARHFVYRKSWTEIRESQDDFKGNYFVGYDCDRSQFLMIDADDPASEAYFTEGWHGKTLLLTSVNEILTEISRACLYGSTAVLITRAVTSFCKFS
jgi:hypothetical protein